LTTKTSKDEITKHDKVKVLSQRARLLEKISYFETKYGKILEKFSKELQEKEENHEEWDDYIEWKATSTALKEINDKFTKIFPFPSKKRVNEILQMADNADFVTSGNIDRDIYGK